MSITSFGVYSFELREAPANSAPVAEDDAAETDHGVPVTIDVLANDSDPDGDDLVVDAVTQGAGGTAAIDGNRVTYTPGAGFAGTDSFTYTVAEGLGGSAEATVTVTVHEPPNNPPTVAGIDDREGIGSLVHYRGRAPAGAPVPPPTRDASGGAVDERRVHEQVEPRVSERPTGDRRRPADLPHSTSHRPAGWTRSWAVTGSCVSQSI